MYSDFEHEVAAIKDHARNLALYRADPLHPLVELSSKRLEEMQGNNADAQLQKAKESARATLKNLNL